MSGKEIKYLGALGVLLAIFGAVIPVIGIEMDLTMLSLILLLVGIAAGAMIGRLDVKTGILILLILAIAGMANSLPVVGRFVKDLFMNFATFLVGLALIPIVKILLTKFGIKI
jgi:hypothetical protein